MIKVDGTGFGIADNLEKFSIQSIAKVLSLALAVKFLGEKSGRVLPLNLPEPSLIRCFH